MPNPQASTATTEQGDLDPLFKNRTAEAAARQLAVVLAWATECSLATLERLEGKRSAKSEVQRQVSVCSDLVRHCKELGIRPSGLRGVTCARLKQALDSLDDTTKG